MPDPSPEPPSLPPFLQVDTVCQSVKGEGGPLILENVSFAVKEGETVGLLGRSGSGKSLLLRIIAGIQKPDSGTVFWQGAPLHGPTSDIAMAFSTVALFPWLNVHDNISLVLEARKLKRAERDERIRDAISLIGPGGHESAMPGELSDGMACRAGLARALSVRPRLLLLDEPFSGLDVLTAENLRTDLLELRDEGRLPCQSMLLVTHSIEEAVLMCDRVLLFSSGPGQITEEVAVPLPFPRNREDPLFRQMVDHLYSLMTRRTPVQSEADLPQTPAIPRTSPLLRPLTPVTTDSMTGLAEVLEAPPLNGRADLPLLAEKTQLGLDDLFPLIEALQLLGFAEPEDGDILLTEEGIRFVQSDSDERRISLRHAIMQEIPLARAICATLDERPGHTADAARFRETLAEGMSASYATQTVQAIIEWARCAELFDYNEETDQFFLADSPDRKKAARG